MASSWPSACALHQALAAYTGDRTTGPLLIDAGGQALDRHDIDALLTRLGKRAGILLGRDLTPHVLRATRLTHMHDEGVPVEEIQAFADHDNIATTLGYIRRRGEHLRRARHAAAGANVIAGHLQRWATATSPAQA